MFEHKANNGHKSDVLVTRGSRKYCDVRVSIQVTLTNGNKFRSGRRTETDYVYVPVDRLRLFLQGIDNATITIDNGRRPAGVLVHKAKTYASRYRPMTKAETVQAWAWVAIAPRQGLSQDERLNAAVREVEAIVEACNVSATVVIYVDDNGDIDFVAAPKTAASALAYVLNGGFLHPISAVHGFENDKARIVGRDHDLSIAVGYVRRYAKAHEEWKAAASKTVSVNG